MNVTFGVFADLHTEYIHDAPQRVDEFLKQCRGKADFCVELGDFCPPGDTNIKDKQYILERISQAGIPFYHVLGNHDMDKSCKADVLDYIGVSDSHLSFDCGNVHFITLDACFYRFGDKYYPYERGNYKNAPENVLLPILPPSELEWLKKDLEKSKFPSVIFTHQSLIESRAGIKNSEELREIISKAPNGVLLAICGHEHVDRLEKKDGTWYYCLNSMSYYWAGSKYRHDTYDKDITADHPYLESVFPYRDPLYAFIEITDNAIYINGTASEFVGLPPEKINFVKKGLCDPITASVTNRKIDI